MADDSCWSNVGERGAGSGIEGCCMIKAPKELLLATIKIMKPPSRCRVCRSLIPLSTTRARIRGLLKGLP
jgi:hypothetical protein